MKKNLVALFYLAVVSVMFASCADTGAKNGSAAKKAVAEKPAQNLSEEEKTYKATTTIYYVPSFNRIDADNCSVSQKVNLLNKAGHTITKVCKKIFDACAMQGTCRVATHYGKNELLNVDGVKGGVRRFRIISDDQCKYGFGASSDGAQKFKKVCLEPFYTVAADLSLYNLGDVIYFPDLKGVVLPNGEVHDGYVIVRDVGGNIKGRGRFDVFTGGYGLDESKNPFARLNLHDKDTHPKYMLVDGVDAERVLQRHLFPLIP